MIELYEKDWAINMARDCTSARQSISASALSLLPPRHTTDSPFGQLWQAWCAAAARGVPVVFFLAAPSKSHPATAQNITAGALARAAGMSARYVPQPGLLHAKTLVIDERIVWIGSGNFTAAAAHYNHEIYCRFESVEIAQRILTRWNNIAGA